MRNARSAGIAKLFALLVLSSVPLQAQAPRRIEGKVCDVTGAPLAGATLEADAEDGSGPTARGAADATGNYVLEIAKDGRYRLSVKKDGYLTATLQPVEISAGASRRLDVVLQKGQGNAGAIQFSDEPSYTVAGVTDWSNVGLHGSDVNVRTGEALAREAAALKNATGNAKASSREAEAHRLAGDAREKAGDPLAAVREYEAATRLEPSEENYFAWGAELLLHRGGLAAVEVFQKGAAAHANSPRMRAGLGAAYYFDGEYGKAADEMCAAADLKPEDAAAYLFLGRMEKSAAELFPCAEPRLERFAGRQPRNWQAAYYYGIVLRKKARRSQRDSDALAAQAALQQALSLATREEQGDVYLQLGMLYNARGQKSAAQESFEKAIASNPSLGEAHYQLSLLYRQAGTPARAEQEMKTYQQLRKAEDAALEQERKASRQFVTTLRGGSEKKPQ